MATSSIPINEILASLSPNTALIVTITRDDTPRSTSAEQVLITDSAPTAGSDLAPAYVFTKSVPGGSSSPSSATNRNTSGLSSGAVAGIVISSIIFLIFLLLLVFCTSRHLARRRRREKSSLHTQPDRASFATHGSVYQQARSQVSIVYVKSSSPQEPATRFNQLEIDGRGRSLEVLGSYVHPVKLQAGRITGLVAQTWKGHIPPRVRKGDEPGVGYLNQSWQRDGSDAGSGLCLSSRTWEKEF